MQAQRTECVNKAIEMGCSIENIHIFGDDGISGAILERPQLMAALNMLKRRSNDIRFFICYDSSRLSRNAAHQLIIVDEIKKREVQLVFIKNNYQDNAEGRFQLTVMAAVDEYERARLRLRTEMGKRVKASQHKLTHNPGLYGYDFDPKTDTLSINEEHAKNLKLMFELLIDEFMGPAEIAEKFNESDIPSPRMKLWNRVTVRRILSNPSYLGILYIRRYDTRDCHLNKFKKKGEKIKVKEKPQCEWVPIQIPQIIDNNTWERAQNALKKSKLICKKNKSVDFLLTPLLRCGICGSAMNGKSISKGEDCYRYYICAGKYKDEKEKKCEAMLVKADEIEKAVWKSIYASIKSFIIKELDSENLIGRYMSNKGNDSKNIIIKKEKAKNENERIKIMFQKGYLDEEEMLKKLDGIKKRIARLDAEAAPKGEHQAEFLEMVKKSFSKENLPYVLEEMLNKLDNKGRSHILGLLVSEITVTGKTVLIKGSPYGFPSDTTLVGDVPESYITVPENEIPNYTPINDPFDSK
ncbi:MAG TPA: recombinase family protein [Clostridia bacterium]|nr:recombinase family protein [Clostridia bacterium]